MTRRIFFCLRVFISILMLSGWFSLDQVSAATFVVTNTDDSGPGSLRQAIIDANGDPTPPRLVDASGVSGTIVLASDLTPITAAMSIFGPNSLDLIVDGAGSFRPLTVNAPGVVFGLVIQNGLAVNGGGVSATSSLLLAYCWIRGNVASGTGGGVFLDSNIDDCTFINCIVSGNTATSGNGGGFHAMGQGLAGFFNSTIVGNSASEAGGGVAFDAAMLTSRGDPAYTFANTIVALNTAPIDPDISTRNGRSFTSSGGNLIGNNSGIDIGFAIAGAPNVDGDFVGTGASPIDPDFLVDVPAVPSIAGDLRVAFGSIAIDNGLDANADPNLNDPNFFVDYDVRPRRFSTVDIGAFEFGSTDCRLGNVNALGAGGIMDVLFVNGSAGTGFDRRITVNRNAPLQISMAAPLSPVSAPFVAYAYAGDAIVDLERVLPSGVGTFCMPNPITDPAAPPLLAPLEIWNNLGFPGQVGAATRASLAAPSILVDLPAGPGRGLTVFIQALIRDDNSPNGQIAVTNSVTIVFP